MTKFMKTLTISAAFTCLLGASGAQADVEVAVVHVFQPALVALVAAFKTSTSPTYDDVTFTYTLGSAGGLYNTINGALAAGGTSPYDLFMAVDPTYPTQLHTSYPSDVGTPFQYAQGSLSLVSDQQAYDVTSGLPSNFTTTGVCNPDSGPYGDAALQTLYNVYSISSTDSRVTKYDGIGLVKNAVIAHTMNTGWLAKAQICNGSGGVDMQANGFSSNASHHEYAPGSPNYDASVLLHTGVVLARSGTSAHEQAAIAAFTSYLATTGAQTIIQNNCYTIPTTKTTAAQSYESVKSMIERLNSYQKGAGSEKPKH